MIVERWVTCGRTGRRVKVRGATEAELLAALAALGWRKPAIWGAWESPVELGELSAREPSQAEQAKAVGRRVLPVRAYSRTARHRR